MSLKFVWFFFLYEGEVLVAVFFERDSVNQCNEHVSTGVPCFKHCTEKLLVMFFF